LSPKAHQLLQNSLPSVSSQLGGFASSPNPSPTSTPLHQTSQPTLSNDFFFQNATPVAPTQPQLNVNYAFGNFQQSPNIAAQFPVQPQPGPNFYPATPQTGPLPGQYPPSPTRPNANYYPTSPSAFRQNMGNASGLFESIAATGPQTGVSSIRSQLDPYANLRNL